MEWRSIAAILFVTESVGDDDRRSATRILS
jgi:hypothetical protein